MDDIFHLMVTKQKITEMFCRCHAAAGGILTSTTITITAHDMRNIKNGWHYSLLLLRLRARLLLRLHSVIFSMSHLSIQLNFEWKLLNWMHSGARTYIIV